MNRDYSALAHRPLPPGARVSAPASPPPLALDTPAIEAMTDLRAISAASIAADRSLEECNTAMRVRAVRLLFVEDAERRVVGVITTTDLLGEKPVRFMQERGVRRQEILVSDLMTPAARLEALDLREVEHAQVGQIIATLKAAGRQHTFVTEDGGARICGIFSASHMARRLGADIPIHEVAMSFAEIEASLAR